MSEHRKSIPAVALRGMTILPGMIAHFDVSRERSVKAVEEAMLGDQSLFLVTQREVEEDNPQIEDLYRSFADREQSALYIKTGCDIINKLVTNGRIEL